MRAFECGTLIDGLSEPIEDAVVLVEDGEIEAAGPRESVGVPDDAEVVDHAGETVIPGMIDAHVHMYGFRELDLRDRLFEGDALAAARATGDLRRLLAAGFTAVRDLGSRIGLGLREAVAEGSIPGPRVYTSGLAISQTAGHGDVHNAPYEWIREGGAPTAALADGPDECRREARKRIRRDADVLKVMTTGGAISRIDPSDVPQYTDAELAAVVEEAHRFNKPVAAHAHGAEGVKLALRNGIDTIEHGVSLDGEAIDALVESRAALVPTLVVYRRLVEKGAEHGLPDYALRTAEEVAQTHVESIRRAHEAGVPIALGTDATGNPPNAPHGASADEAVVYVEDVGMSEMEAIRSATSVAARALDDDRIGAIEPGRRADLVALSSDPLADIEALYDVEAVYTDGDRAPV